MRMNRPILCALCLAVSASPTALLAGTGGAPRHMVAFMTNPDQTTCPGGWQEFSYAQGRMVLGVTETALAPKDNVPGVAGTPMADGTPPSHSHGFAIKADVGLQPVSQAVYTHEAGKSDKYDTSGTTDAAPVDLPFIQYLVCEKTDDPVSDIVPAYSYAFFNRSDCPDGWAVEANMNGRFILPISPGDTPGQLVGDPWSDGNEPPHDHHMKTTIDLDTVKHHSHKSGSDGFAQSGKQPVSGTSNPSTALPLVRLLVCGKGFGGGDQAAAKADVQTPAATGTAGDLAAGLMLFSPIEDCTTLGDRWVAPIGVGGRFVVGIGGNGTQGLTFPRGLASTGDAGPGNHSHAFSGEVKVASRDDKKITNGFYPSKSYGKGGKYNYHGTTGDFDLAPPYVVLRACALQ